MLVAAVLISHADAAGGSAGLIVGEAITGLDTPGLASAAPAGVAEIDPGAHVGCLGMSEDEGSLLGRRGMEEMGSDDRQNIQRVERTMNLLRSDRSGKKVNERIGEVYI